MTHAELLTRLGQDEDALVERKTKGDRSGVMEALSAFANSVDVGQEAVLFIGVRPDKTVVGVENADKLQQTIHDWAQHECYPPIDVQFQVLNDAWPGPVLAVIVRGSSNRPHFTGHAYTRIGSRTVKASAGLFEDLVASRHDKARLILRHKGQQVTFLKYVGMFGQLRPVSDVCEIEHCDAHAVRVRHVGSGIAESIPLDWLSISDDPEHHRPLKLIAIPPTAA